MVQPWDLCYPRCHQLDSNVETVVNLACGCTSGKTEAVVSNQPQSLTLQWPLLFRRRPAPSSSSSSSPVCHCVWQKTGWCGGSWSPWRCPKDGRRRRSCCSVPEWTWWCTKRGTGTTGKTKHNISQFIHPSIRWIMQSVSHPWNCQTGQLISEAQAPTYIVCKHYSHFPDVVLRIDWAQPGNRDRLMWAVRIFYLTSIFALGIFQPVQTLSVQSLTMTPTKPPWRQLPP